MQFDEDAPVLPPQDFAQDPRRAGIDRLARAGRARRAITVR